MRLFSYVITFVIGLVAGLFSLAVYQKVTGSVPSTGSMISALPGACIGLITLLYTIFNHMKIQQLQKAAERRDFDVDAFYKYAATPVEDALKKIDTIMDKVEDIFFKKDRNPSLKKEMMEDLQTEAFVTIQAVYRLCREADLYLKQRRIKGRFEVKMYKVGDDRLDDVIIGKLADACTDVHSLVASDVRLSQVKEIIAQKKACIRGEITAVAHWIANKDDHKAIRKK